MFTLSHDQQNALHSIVDWYEMGRKNKQYITLGGYAGTGKSTLLAFVRKELMRRDRTLRVAFASYTGKASRVLRSKLTEQDILMDQDSVGTIHSLIYSPLLNDEKQIVGWKVKEKIEPNLIIIDEASMVDAVIWQHLLSYNVPIIAVGDHGQLPPISGSFNLMARPELQLSEIHRQAKHDPIIGLSIQAREHGLIHAGEYSPTVRKYANDDYDTQEVVNELLSGYNSETLILCGYNHTRKKLNAFIRSSLGFESPKPLAGDRVICLRNNHKEGIFNGMLGTVDQIEIHSDDWYAAQIVMDGEDRPYRGLISSKQFSSDTPLNMSDKRKDTLAGDLFDFGYAMTVHKAQGSQAKRVVLFEERFSKMSDEQWRRWLYTAVTRAQEELYIFGS